MKRFAYSCVVGFALAMSSPLLFAQPPQLAEKSASSTTMGDRSWVVQMYEASIEDVRLGKLASTKASTQDARVFGQMMVSDHSTLNKELKVLADRKGIRLNKPRPVSTRQKMLTGLSRAQFDLVYIRTMVDDHRLAIAAFDRQARKGGDPNLTSWAGKQLPTLRRHLSIAQGFQHTLEPAK